MGLKDKLYNALENVSAQLLAAQPGDGYTLTHLAGELDRAANQLDADSASRSALTRAAGTIRAISDAPDADFPTAIDALTGVVSAAAGLISSDAMEDDTTDLQAALAELEKLGVAPAGPIDRQTHDTPAPAEPETSDTSEDDTAATASAEQSPPDGSDADDEPDDEDAELVVEFAGEAREHISAAEAALLELEKNPDDAESINTVLRAFHTIKGAAGFMELDRIQQLAHQAENLLISARDGHVRIVDDRADLALRSCDVLKSLVDQAESGEDDPSGTRRADELADDLSASEYASTSEASDGDSEPEADGTRSQTAGADAQPADESPGRQTDRKGRLTGQSDGSARVSTERLDELVNMVGELVISHSIVAQNPEVDNASRQLAQSVARTGKIVRELQDLAMSLRMVPLQSTFQKMARLVRDLARRSGKHVELITSGEDTEIDRNMVETLNDPLVHLIRNAVDHGIEQSGSLRLAAYHSAGNVVIEIADDGRGLDREQIRQKAVRAGIVPAERQLVDEEIAELIFHPGLSTAETVTDVSGRGVGMDVVKRNVESIRGRVEVATAPGEGTTFTLRLPLTMAIVDTMAVRVGSEQYLLPTIAIERSFRPEPGSVFAVAGRGEMVRNREQLMPLHRLGKLFEVDGAVTDPAEALLIVVGGAGRRYALMVDEILGQQQAVVKTLGPALQQADGLAGGAILGDGRVGLILDAEGIARMATGGSGHDDSDKAVA